MPLLEALSLSSSLPEIENIWTLHLVDTFADVPVIAWRIRWKFSDPGTFPVNITWGGANAVETYFDKRLAPTKVVSLEHPYLPIDFYVASEHPDKAKAALDSFAGGPGIHALANSFHVLRASFAAQTAHALLQCELPILLINRDGTIHRHTPLAFLMINSANNQITFNDRRQLNFPSASQEAAFKAALAQAFSKPRVPHRIRCAGFSMTFTATETTRNHPLATLVLRALNTTPIVDVRELQAEFKLTLSQARLAKALIGGETLDDYATRTGISRKGVKWHLHPLMKKLECASRDQLVRKLVRWAG